MTTTEIEFNTRFVVLLSEASGQPAGWISSEKERLLEDNTKRPDFLLDRPGLPPFVVEAKFAESSADPTDDIVAKLGLKCSDRNKHVAGLRVKSGAALEYPAGCKDWTEEEMRRRFLDGGETLRWRLASVKDGGHDIFPSAGWIEGDIYDFWGSISRTALNTEETAKLGSEVTQRLKAAAKHMLSVTDRHDDDQKRIAAMMGEPQDLKAGMEIACVVWLDALLMMNELAREEKELRPDAATAKSIDACRTSTGSPQVSKIWKEWNKVLDDNYESIFKPAKTALPAVSFSDMTQAFVFLFEAVEEIECARLGKIANIGGEIFARVMDSQQRKNTASFYTKPQVSEFLAALTIPTAETLPADWTEWRIADFACGTGSLLRAGYRRLLGFAAKHKTDIQDFHKQMMENNLYGLDVSTIAAHLSATTVVNLFPAVSYDDMKIGPVNFGTEGGKAYAGSLELADSKTEGALFNENFVSLKGSEGEGVSRIGADDESFAAVIMNPPYSRTRGGQAVADLSGISDAKRARIQERIRELRRNTLGNGKAGLASDFLSLASQKLADGGRMGFVLPLTFAAAGSYLKIRDHLLENFSDITLTFFSDGISSGGESLSDDTKMEELMLTATKGKSGREGVRYVKLDGSFPSASYAAEAAKQVWNTEADVRKGETKGTLYAGADRIGEWFHSEKPPAVWGLAGSSDIHGFASDAELLAGGHLVSADADVRFPVTALSSLLDIGSTHHKIGFMSRISGKEGVKEGDRIGAFRWHEIVSDSDARKKDLSLWHAKYDLCTSVNTQPTHYGTEYDSSKTGKMREEKTDLFLQRNMTWSSQKALAARTAKPCLGGRSWTGLSHVDADVKDAFTVWANSIFGFAAYWSQSQRQQQGRSCMQIGDTTRLRVPDFGDAEMLARAEAVLDSVDIEGLFAEELDRAYFCRDDAVRQKVNKLAADMLGIPEHQQAAVIDALQIGWTSEPSVTPNPELRPGFASTKKAACQPPAASDQS